MVQSPGMTLTMRVQNHQILLPPDVPIADGTWVEIHTLEDVKAGEGSLHERLQQYQSAGETGVVDLAANPQHLAEYGRK